MRGGSGGVRGGQGAREQGAGSRSQPASQPASRWSGGVKGWFVVVVVVVVLGVEEYSSTHSIYIEIGTEIGKYMYV